MKRNISVTTVTGRRLDGTKQELSLRPSILYNVALREWVVCSDVSGQRVDLFLKHQDVEEVQEDYTPRRKLKISNSCRF
jgi:hypothetical protein